jgi:uncharacterized membrane protein YkoI
MSTSFEKSVYVFYSMLLAAGCDAPDDSATRVRNTVADAEVTLVQAIDAAVLATPGAVVVEAELEVEATTPVYEVRVLADANLTKILVDPASGAVLRSEVDGDAKDLAEATAAAAVVQTAAIGPAAAIALAEDQRPGSQAFELEVKDGMVEVEVVDDDGLFEIHIDPADGSVVRVDASDDDHHGSDDDSDDDEPGDDDGNDDDEPGDDDGNDGAEPGDDDGNDSAEPGDDDGNYGAEPGDDDGDDGAEPGDDDNGDDSAEPGDDKP